MSEIKSKQITIVMISVILFASGIFGGFLIANGPLSQARAVSSGASGIFQLDLVITTNNWYNNSIGYQPSYFVVQNDKLVSAANISIPGNVPVQVTIVDYDNGSAIVPSEFANVTGVTGNAVFLVNNTNVNATNGQNGNIDINGGYSVSHFAPDSIAHTFTIFRDGRVVVNIPVMPSSTEFATFTLSPGSYQWHCEALCGSGPYGAAGAMLSPGWMAGTISAS
jgi:hypothetical protein